MPQLITCVVLSVKRKHSGADASANTKTLCDWAPPHVALQDDQDDQAPLHSTPPSTVLATYGVVGLVLNEPWDVSVGLITGKVVSLAMALVVYNNSSTILGKVPPILRQYCGLAHKTVDATATVVQQTPGAGVIAEQFRTASTEKVV